MKYLQGRRDSQAALLRFSTRSPSPLRRTGQVLLAAAPGPAGPSWECTATQAQAGSNRDSVALPVRPVKCAVAVTVARAGPQCGFSLYPSPIRVSDRDPLRFRAGPPGFRVKSLLIVTNDVNRAAGPRAFQVTVVPGGGGATVANGRRCPPPGRAIRVGHRDDS